LKRAEAVRDAKLDDISKLSNISISGVVRNFGSWLYSLESVANVSYDPIYSNIKGANFKGAHLGGAKMLCLGMDEAELDGAFYDEETVWPNGFNPQLKGAVLVAG
jgi:uncharacterized protein YjbI with pentapeptide repeats